MLALANTRVGISTHTLPRRATKSSRLTASVSLYFNSRHPAEGDIRQLNRFCHLQNFNSRPPAEGDQAYRHFEKIGAISTHTLPWRAT